MGQAKLLLPWKDERIIDKVLSAWTASDTFETIVVVRSDDEALSAACRTHRVIVVHPPKNPRDMKESVLCGLREIATRYTPTASDRCFIAPADLPTLSSEMINRLIATSSDDSTIVVPRFGGKTGHPALLPWPITGEIFNLRADEGVNRIVDVHPTIEVPFAADQLVKDVDTPEEYQSLLDSYECQ